MSFDLLGISKQLNAVGLTEIGVSFDGKSLKLNTEKDAEEVCDEIKKCSRLDFLNLAGNTLGPDAAKAISEALATHGSHLKRALWKDMFTGRMKSEIPKALEHLGNGLNIATARLVELDLSDNAFGPIGLQGLAALLSSTTCYTLQELRLNNNGLGITGGEMLAKALLDCHANSSKEGKPLALRVFVAGRNRLENSGAKALAAVFEKLGTLEEVVMPQNGIYHPGVAALVNALALNPGLQVLNLNDNTVGPKGAQALADVLHNFPALKHLNLGDCLLKTRGALIIANALGIQGNHTALVELDLAFNEIRTRGADPIARAMADKTELALLSLDGNFFGEAGRAALSDALANCDRIEALDSLDEDVTDDEESDYGEENEEEEEEEEEIVGENEEEHETNGIESEKANGISAQAKKKEVDVVEFLKTPSGENLLLLPGDKTEKLLEHAKMSADYLDSLLLMVMKVSSLCDNGYTEVRTEAERLTDSLYSELFGQAKSSDEMSRLNNNLLVNLGLMKGEYKNTTKIDWHLDGCFKALEKVTAQEYFPTMTRSILKVFIDKPLKLGRSREIDPHADAKKSLKIVLDGLYNT